MTKTMVNGKIINVSGKCMKCSEMRGENMEYEKPVIVIYDEKALAEIELDATSSCHCTMSGSRVHY